MITVCVPTRARPGLFRKFLKSVTTTSRGPIEVVAYLDDDDPTADDYPKSDIVKYVRGPRIVQSDMWNKCWDAGQGDVAMLAGDDMTFRTMGWNKKIEAHYDDHGDRILMLWTTQHYAAAPFVSREWIDVAGTFTPPYFASWYADRWIWEIAEMINRDRFVKGVNIQHPTVRQRRGIMDATYEDGERFRKNADLEGLYESPKMLAERQAQAMRLSEYIVKQRRNALLLRLAEESS